MTAAELSQARTIVACDVGGTHARFVLAKVADGEARLTGEPITLATGDFLDFEAAWAEFARHCDAPLPSSLALAFAGPTGRDPLKLTNSGWTIERDRVRERLGLDELTIVNDFGAVAHAVAALSGEHFKHLCGPDEPLSTSGVTSVIGPGTGLGSAILLRRSGAHQVIESEGGHIGFAPADAFEDRLLSTVRARFGRVSVERLVSGPGLTLIHEALPESTPYPDDKSLWQAALAGKDAAAAEALESFCGLLGSVAGDLALAQGVDSVVIGGGLGLRLAAVLPTSTFAARFAAKGRMRQKMEAMPVKLVTYPQPGLFGAAVAFAQEHP